MKAIAAHALVVIGARQGVGVVDEGMGAVEGGIEAGDLRNRRKRFHRRLDSGDVVRLVERRKRNEGAQFHERSLIDQDRLGIIRPAVDDAMADRGNRRIVPRVLEPFQNGAHRRHMIDTGPRLVEPECALLTRGCRDAAQSGRADPLDFA